METVLIVYMALTLLGLLLGYWYAWRIATHPLDSWKTWIEVVVGVAFTCAIIGGLLVVSFVHFQVSLSTVLVVAFIPVWSFALTGLPMILGQQLKKFFSQQHHVIRQLATDAVRKAWRDTYDDAEE